MMSCSLLLQGCGSHHHSTTAAPPKPPVKTTAPPVQTTAPPVQTTAPPVQTTAPPVKTTAPPVKTTPAPVSPDGCETSLTCANCMTTNAGVTITQHDSCVGEKLTVHITTSEAGKTDTDTTTTPAIPDGKTCQEVIADKKKACGKPE